jgi:hypothetical protein
MHHPLSSPRTTPNVLSQPISANLLPLNLLPRNRQLPPQTLERTLTQLPKGLVQILLILPLRRRNLPYDVLFAHAVDADLLVGEQPDVAVFVVVHVDLDGAGERAGGWVVDVGRAPAAVPVVCGRVFVCDGDDGDGGVVGGGEDAVRGVGVVFRGVCFEGSDEALAVALMLAWGIQSLLAALGAAIMNGRTLGLPVGSPAQSSAQRLPCLSHGQSRKSFVSRRRSIGRLLSCCTR